MTASMKRVWRLWTFEESVWTEWMRKRYIMGRGLREIDKRPNADSALCAGILDDRSTFNNFLICNPNYEFHWAGTDNEFSFKNVVETIRLKRNPDILAKEVWSSSIIKQAMTIWRARWNRITTRLELVTRPRSQQENTDCLLCEGPMEPQVHLFFRCEFAQQIWERLRQWRPGLFLE